MIQYRVEREGGGAEAFDRMNLCVCVCVCVMYSNRMASNDAFPFGRRISAVENIVWRRVYYIYIERERERVSEREGE